MEQTREQPRPEIARALRFVADNLTHQITVSQIARAAGLSEFHLHRVFHATVGESIGRFITRRRLENAALRLAYEPRVTVTTVALESGYSSSSNFSKAFGTHFGCSPSHLREPHADLPVAVGRLTSRYGKPFDPQRLYSLPPGPTAGELQREIARWDACVRYERIDARPLACLASPGGYAFAEVSQTWAELISRARQLGLCGDSVDAWGIAHDSPELTAPELCRYHACVPCPPDTHLVPPLFPGHMLAGRYAVFPYAGTVAGVGDAYRAIYSCWFRNASAAPADFVPFDHYIGDEPRDGLVDMELWFRLQS